MSRELADTLQNLGVGILGCDLDDGLRLMIRVGYDSISNDGGVDDCSGRIKDVTK